jgi:hypothetical protein|tara:strand:- start:293 stop:490 length:198 start_codon:yes stop_codon:yes gene_type:complete
MERRYMKVGDLVTFEFNPDDIASVGIVTCIDPEELGDSNEVEVLWSDGDARNHSTRWLEVISESR